MKNQQSQINKVQRSNEHHKQTTADVETEGSAPANP
jgi:hypothetical protein